MRFSQWTHLLMCLSFETLTSIIRTGLSILVELIDLMNSVIIFVSQTTWLRLLTFLLGSQTVNLTVLLFWIYFILLMLVFVLQWLFLHWESSMLLSHFPLTFYHIHNEMPCFIAVLMIIFVLIGTVFMIIWEMFHGRISLNSVLLLLLVRAQVGIDVYIPHRKYQVKPHSSPWFSAACAAAIVHRNHFFVCTKKINLLILK